MDNSNQEELKQNLNELKDMIIELSLNLNFQMYQLKKENTELRIKMEKNKDKTIYKINQIKKITMNKWRK